MGQWKAFIRDEDYCTGKNLFVAEEHGEGRLGVLLRPETGFVMKSVGPGERTPELPFMDGRMADRFIQAIMDAGWAHGYRPTGISGERGEIRRLEEHLADMRLLALPKA